MLTVDFEKLNVQENDLVLDAGCGFGRHSLEFLSRGASVLAVDLDLESLRRTRFALHEFKKTASKANDFLVHSADALNLPFKDETFDKIICSEVMEHVSDDQKSTDELYRVLKKGGRIAITVPTLFSEQIYDFLTHEYFSSPGGHVRKYKPKNLIKILEKSGFKIYGVGFKHSFHTIWWIIRCVVGLHLDQHPLTRWYHKFLHLGLYSKTMRKIELFFNYFFPKSIVFYAWKE